MQSFKGGIVSKRIIGLDYGTRRIGIAVSDPLLIIARGVGVVMNTPAAIDEIAKAVAEYDAGRIVVGMPLNLKGEKAMKALEVNGFIALLQQRLPLEIVAWDERFTSRTAQRTLLEMGVKKSGRRRKGIIDEMAAALILQSYLDRLNKEHAYEL